ncbi:MAG: hypothetical protein Q4Q23_00895 [Methanobacteriaceae archaeon]|nr:hypothetical protein [Methanobacteriaceae archaeon]
MTKIQILLSENTNENFYFLEGVLNYISGNKKESINKLVESCEETSSNELLEQISDLLGELGAINEHNRCEEKIRMLLNTQNEIYEKLEELVNQDNLLLD